MHQNIVESQTPCISQERNNFMASQKYLRILSK